MKNQPCFSKSLCYYTRPRLQKQKYIIPLHSLSLQDQVFYQNLLRTHHERKNQVRKWAGWLIPIVLALWTLFCVALSEKGRGLLIAYWLKGVRFATLAQTSVIFNRPSPYHPRRISRLRKEVREQREGGDIFQLSGNVLARIQEARVRVYSFKTICFLFQ